VISARSSVWHAVELWYVLAANRISGPLTRGGRRRLLVYPALLSMGAGALASCAGQTAQPSPQASVVSPSPPRREPPAAPRDIPRPVRKPSPPSPLERPTATPGEEALAMTAPKPSPSGPAPGASQPPPSSQVIGTSLGPARSPLPQTNELIGLDQPAATRLFGPPAERSDQPPATVWRYKNATCELDLFFYLDLRSGRMQTLHYAVKGDGGDAGKRQDCLQSLVTARGN
jgi:hypothetical protein